MRNLFTPIIISLSSAVLATAQVDMPEIDLLQSRFSTYGDMEFEDGPGDLRMSRLMAQAPLSKPIHLTENAFFFSMLRYDLAMLEMNSTYLPTTQHEDLHSLSLMSALVYMDKSSPWIFGGFAQAELASDFQHINGDDFTFDLGAGAAYRFSNQFTLGIGVAAIDLNGDALIFPGINFDWKISETFRAGLYGPNILVSYTPSDDWSLSLRGRPSGGAWNFTDDLGASRNYNLSGYQVGLYGSHRLIDQLFLQIGAGMTFGGDLEVQRPNGDTLWSDDLGNAIFGEISLVLKTW